MYYLLQSALWDSLELDAHSFVTVMELHATQWPGNVTVPLGRQGNTVRKVRQTALEIKKCCKVKKENKKQETEDRGSYNTIK